MAMIISCVITWCDFLALNYYLSAIAFLATFPAVFNCNNPNLNMVNIICQRKIGILYRNLQFKYGDAALDKVARCFLTYPTRHPGLDPGSRFLGVLDSGFRQNDDVFWMNYGDT